MFLITYQFLTAIDAYVYSSYRSSATLPRKWHDWCLLLSPWMTVNVVVMSLVNFWYAKKFLELWYKKNFVSLSCLSSNRFSSFGILGAMVWEALSNPLLDTELYRLGRWRLHTWNTGDKQWRQGSQTMTITSWCDGVYFLVWVQASFVEDGDDDNELV
jgi:hypothetical protein